MIGKTRWQRHPPFHYPARSNTQHTRPNPHIQQPIRHTDLSTTTDGQFRQRRHRRGNKRKECEESGRHVHVRHRRLVPKPQFRNEDAVAVFGFGADGT